MDPAGITEALREACSIVDEVLPWELGAGPRNRSVADRGELRKVALGVILTALLPQSPVLLLQAPALAAEEDGGPDWLKTSEVARLLGASAGAVYHWERKGLLTPSRTPSGQRRYARSEVEALRGSDYGQRSARRRNPDDGLEEIVRLRIQDGLSWDDIAAKTGMSQPTVRRRFERWAAQQLAAAARAPASAAVAANP